MEEHLNVPQLGAWYRHFKNGVNQRTFSENSSFSPGTITILFQIGQCFLGLKFFINNTSESRARLKILNYKNFRQIFQNLQNYQILFGHFAIANKAKI